MKPSPLAFIAFLLAGWISRQQLVVIDYLKAENRILRERLKGRSLLFSDRECALLARKAFGIPRKALLELGTIVTPDRAGLVASCAVTEFVVHYHCERNHPAMFGS